MSVEGWELKHAAFVVHAMKADVVRLEAERDRLIRQARSEGVLKPTDIAKLTGLTTARIAQLK